MVMELDRTYHAHQFSSHVSILTRDIEKANLSVCLFVCLSVCLSVRPSVRP